MRWNNVHYLTVEFNNPFKLLLDKTCYVQYEVSQSAGHHRFVTSNSYKSSTGYTIYQLVCETVIMVLGIQRVYETKLRSPKKRKWSPLTFGLDSVQFRPNLSMKNRIYKKSLHRSHGLEFFVKHTKFSKIAKGIPRKKRLKSTDLNNALLCSDG